ncbi:MAG TPA: arsenic efflux protein [Candidatus Borkfalkia avistercoris]|mgnify:FL=1|uniref:Arsenic efflux protein n=1 Tax=Candidatus Borkfalkia avistercoris TaxID=2838504 RepID=A0A9D2ICZ2_9FIRM|nr:arsenic efflux protein [Candidatus Borkfalkia avistercoris]
MFAEIMEIVLDALLDSLKVFPFLFLMYVLIEFLENRTNITKNKNILRGNLAPLLGAATGIIPQCGFSVMAAKLYDKKIIRTGTVLAVFLATSDEALIILLSSGQSAIAVMPLIAIKFAVAVGVGYLFNALLRREALAELAEGEEIHGTPCGHDHEEDSKVRRYLLHPLLHSLEIFAYILVVNLAFGFAMHYAEGAITSFLDGGYWFQPLIAGLVGLIPNCASSVLVTQSYVLGALSFGGMTAGLCANAGLGFVILFKNIKSWKRNLALLGILYVVSVAVGYAVLGVMQLF